MKVVLTLGETPAKIAPATLLGQQIEACYGAVEGMLSDRLDNAKFAAPADARTGIAHRWRPTFTTMPGIYCALTTGVSLSGCESQMCHCYWPETELAGIQQTGRQLRAGEVLELELWAKAMSTPVNIRVGLKPLSAQAPVYAQADLCIDAAYWKPYRATFTIPRDDDEAIFYIRLLGEGKLWLDQAHLRPAGEGHVCREMLRRMESLRIPALRFPGGTISNNYHWRYGTGAVHLRPTFPDPVFKATMNYDFGVDDYLDLCHNQGFTPQLTINMGTGTPDEAGEWATYCARWFAGRGSEPPPIYFEMGNELEGHHELGHMTPGMYVAALREYVPAVREGYPAARIGVKADEHYYYLRTDQLQPWRDIVLADALDLADFFIIHSYQGAWRETDIDRQISVIDGIANVQGQLEGLIGAIRAAKGAQPVALTEWNYWLHAGQADGKGFYEPYDAQHGLYVAGVLQMLARLAPNVELANFYNLINPMGVFLHHGADVVESCLADIFRLYRPAFPGEVLPLTVASPPLGEHGPAVDALAMRNAEGVWLFMCNRHPAQAAHVQIDLDGLLGENTVATLLAGESPTGQFHSVDSPLSGKTIDLPPLSLLRLTTRQ
ncbi:MAG: hypothetical protein ACYC7E_09500 [Armatimonadota bacterium]